MDKPTAYFVPLDRHLRALPYIDGVMGRLAYSANNTANPADLREWTQCLHDDLAHALALLKGEEPKPEHFADAGKVIPTPIDTTEEKET